MRIGEVTQENYKEFLKLFGVKDTANLDKFMGKSKEIELDHSFEGNAAAAVASGYAEEGMVGRAGDTSWKKIIPVSDEHKNKLIEVIRKQFLTNKNGMGDYRDGDEIGALYKKFRESIPPSERLSYTYSLSQIRREEESRLYDYVVAHIPSWRPGETIPDALLKGAVSSGLNVKA